MKYNETSQCQFPGREIDLFNPSFDKIGSRTIAPATVAPRRHLLSRPKPSSNQNPDSLSVSPTPTSSSPFTPSPSLRLAPTPSSIRKASVVGEQVSLGSKCPGSISRVTQQSGISIDLIINDFSSYFRR